MIRLATILLLCLSGACKAQKSNQQNGFLIADLKIGPICPHEPCNLTPKEKIAFYNDFHLVIGDSNGVESQRFTVDTNTLVRQSLPPGYYTAGIRPLNYPEGASLDLIPFRIIARKESKIQLFFDTGIR